jgi:hypothetical protein
MLRVVEGEHAASPTLRMAVTVILCPSGDDLVNMALVGTPGDYPSIQDDACYRESAFGGRDSQTFGA